MKPKPTQYEKTLQGYSVETLLEIRAKLEADMMAGNLDSQGAKRLVACKKVIAEKTEKP